MTGAGRRDVVAREPAPDQPSRDWPTRPAGRIHSLVRPPAQRDLDRKPPLAGPALAGINPRITRTPATTDPKLDTDPYLWPCPNCGAPALWYPYRTVKDGTDYSVECGWPCDVPECA